MAEPASRYYVWARRLLWAALPLCAVSAVGGLLILATIWLIAPLLLLSTLLFFLALRRPHPKTLAVLAGVGAALSVLIIARSSQCQWLLPCAGAVALTAVLLLWRPTPRTCRLAAGLVLGFVAMSWLGLRLTPLYQAVAHGDVARTRVLLALGADARGQDKGRPVLQAALENRHPDLLALLLRHGADPNARDNSFGTHTPVLFSAIWSKQPRLVNLLLAAGANPRLRDTLGRDAVQVACDYDYPDSVAVRRAAARFPPEPKPPTPVGSDKE